VKNTFLWRYRVGITSGLLMLLALNLVSIGVKPGDFAQRPVTVVMTALTPVQDTLNSFAHGSTGFVRNYFDLVNVRRDNERLTDRLRKAEIVIDVQKKVAMLLGRPFPETEEL